MALLRASIQLSHPHKILHKHRVQAITCIAEYCVCELQTPGFLGTTRVQGHQYCIRSTACACGPAPGRESLCAAPATCTPHTLRLVRPARPSCRPHFKVCRCAHQIAVQYLRLAAAGLAPRLQGGPSHAHKPRTEACVYVAPPSRAAD